MRIKKSMGQRLVYCCILAFLALVINGCTPGKERACCSGNGAISLDISSLPEGIPLVRFTLDNVVGIRVYDGIRREGTSLWCRGSQQVPPGSGNWENAAVMFFFCRMSCRVCAISAEVHGHGHEARIVAAQRDGTTQTAVCPGDKKILKLNSATKNNPFIYVILSGQEAEWLSIKLE